MVDVSGLPVRLIGTLYRMGPVGRDEVRALGMESAEEGGQAEVMKPGSETTVAGEWSTGR